MRRRILEFAAWCVPPALYAFGVLVIGLNWLYVLHLSSAAIVLAEALNKLERSDLFDGKQGWRVRLVGLGWLAMPWAWKRERVIVVLKALGWSALSIGAAGHLVAPLLGLERPNVQSMAFTVGFGFLVVRSRLKEG